jgi:hypothetical protein
MSNTSKLAAIAIAATAVLVSPAFAQSLETGTAADTYGWTASPAWQIAKPSDGLRAFGMVYTPAPPVNAVAATGGGSRGYNETLLTDQ